MTHRFITGSLTAAPLLLVAACSPGADESHSLGPAEATNVSTSGVGRTTEQDSACDSVGAGQGWVNTFMPQSTATFVVQLANYPHSSATPPLIDTVVGLSNGPADAFTDLGPIVRFNPGGNIDARDGNQYVGGFPYRPGVGAFEFKMDVSIPTHTYTVWIRHRDAIMKPFELLGQNLRFRTQQSTVTRLDNIGRFTDSTQGSLETCGFEYTAPDACKASQAGSWASRAFPAQAGQIRLEFIATATSSSLDAVIGASNGAPMAFASLAPIVRFRPDGTFDARNGAGYSADVAIPYSANTSYQFALDIDVPSATYSASVRDLTIHDNPSIVFAQGYAFRSEQAHVASLNHLGQFVDGTPGSLGVCELTIAY